MVVNLLHFSGPCKKGAVTGKAHPKNPSLILGVCTLCGLILEKYDRKKVKAPEDDEDEDGQSTRG